MHVLLQDRGEKDEQGILYLFQLVAIGREVMYVVSHMPPSVLSSVAVAFWLFQVCAVTKLDQTPVFGLLLQLFGAHFVRLCFGQRGSVGCCLSTGDFPGLKESSPRLLPPYGGWVYYLALLLPNKRNADGAKGIFGNAGRV